MDDRHEYLLMTVSDLERRDANGELFWRISVNTPQLFDVERTNLRCLYTWVGRVYGSQTRLTLRGEPSNPKFWDIYWCPYGLTQSDQIRQVKAGGEGVCFLGQTRPIPKVLCQPKISGNTTDAHTLWSTATEYGMVIEVEDGLDGFVPGFVYWSSNASMDAGWNNSCHPVWILLRLYT